MTNMILSPENLQKGINTFLARPKWNPDFHNSFYRDDLQPLTQTAITPTAWEKLINYLASWRALRPYSKQQMYATGLQYLDAINQALARLDTSAPTFEQASWNVLEPLFQTASAIKAVTSPVFASKLCHFLRPQLYPVVDQAVLGIGNQSYATYWNSGKQRWNECRNQPQLIEQLRQAMQSEPFVDYPWATKIVELCTIGAKQD